MSDELKELKRRLIEDCKDAQIAGNEGMTSGLKVALYEIEHLDKPFVG